MTKIAQQAPAYALHRSQHRANNRRHHYPRHAPAFGLDLEVEVLAALSVVSLDAQTRVNRLMKLRWKHRRRLLIERQRVIAARRKGLLPSQRQILAIARRANLHKVTGTKADSFRALIIKSLPLPKATLKMTAIAERKLLQEREKWDRLCNTMRLRATHHH